MKVIYTDSGRQALEAFKVHQAKELEKAICSRKYVFGDETVEITASDVKELSEMQGLPVFLARKWIAVQSVLWLYIIIGLLISLFGIYFQEISMIYRNNPVQLILIIFGLVFSILSYILLIRIQARQQKQERIERYEDVANSAEIAGLVRTNSNLFFLNPPFEFLEEALVKATERNFPLFAVIYDNDHPKKSKLTYSLGYFMEYQITKKLVDEYFVVALMPVSQIGVRKLVPDDDPLENCRLVVMQPDGQVIYSEGVYANPDEGLKRVRSIIAKRETQ